MTTLEITFYPVTTPPPDNCQVWAYTDYGSIQKAAYNANRDAWEWENFWDDDLEGVIAWAYIPKGLPEKVVV